MKYLLKYSYSQNYHQELRLQKYDEASVEIKVCDQDQDKYGKIWDNIGKYGQLTHHK